MKNRAKEFGYHIIEGQLEVIEVKSQWLKRRALQRFLPLEIKSEAKSLFKLTKTQAGEDIYKKSKSSSYNYTEPSQKMPITEPETE